MTVQACDPVVIRLKSSDGSRVWVHDGGKEILMTSEQVVRACIAYNKMAELTDIQAQVEALAARVGKWCFDHKDQINGAYVSTGVMGKLLFLVVLKGKAFNQEVTDSLTHLDIELAMSQAYSLLKISVRAIPEVSQAEIEAILRHD
jgi:hypothetical protein